MAMCLVSFMDPVSAYRHLLGAGVYITPATAAVDHTGSAGVYATKCRLCTPGAGKLGCGSFVPVLKR